MTVTFDKTIRAGRFARKVRIKSKPFFWKLLKYILLVELAFTILYPLLAQLATTFMTETDLLD